MSLQDHIMMVLRGSPEPLSSPEVARILGLTTNAVSSPISKLCSYGKLELITVELRNSRRGRVRYYRPKVDKGYEEWRDQQYGTECGP